MGQYEISGLIENCFWHKKLRYSIITYVLAFLGETLGFMRIFDIIKSCPRTYMKPSNKLMGQVCKYKNFYGLNTKFEIYVKILNS